jgi:hypothetical protein
MAEANVAWERELSIKDHQYGNDVGDILVGLKESAVAVDQLKTSEGMKFSQSYAPIFLLQSNRLEGTGARGISDETSYRIAQGVYDADEPEEPVGDGFFHADGEQSLSQIAAYSQHRAWRAQVSRHARALTKIMHRGAQNEPLTAAFLVELQADMLKGSKETNREGKVVDFKDGLRAKGEVVCAGEEAFPSFDMALELNKQLEDTEKKLMTLHPVGYACELLRLVATLHPFRNGNGRLCRLCFAYGLARHGISVPVVFSDRHSEARNHYVVALQRAQGQLSTNNEMEYLHNIGVMALHGSLNNMRKCL